MLLFWFLLGAFLLIVILYALQVIWTTRHEPAPARDRSDEGRREPEPEEP